MVTDYWRDFWGASWRRTNPYGTPGSRSIYTKGYHRGEDIANGGNTSDVPALRSGTIIDSGRSGVIGFWVCIQPDDDPSARDIYCHMFEPSARTSGRVDAGDIIGRTAGWGENPGTGWSGPHLHFVVSNKSDGGYNTDRPDYDPRPVISAELAKSTALAGNERRVGSGGARARRDANSSSEKVDDGYLDPGTKWTFNEFERGESVEGNNVWFKGPNSGLFYWSGSFEGGANTANLTEIGGGSPATTPPKTSAIQRVVTGDGVVERTGPGTNFPRTGDDRQWAAGEVLDFKGWTHGETINLNGVSTDIWFQGAYAGMWFSAACFTSQSTDGLTEVKTGGTTTPTTPTTPEWKNRTPDSSLAKWIGSPNFNYRDPRPAGAKPTHITMHWMDGTLSATDSTFQDANRGSASTYGVGQTEIHQYVREIDYQQADGDTNSNRWGLSIEHEAGTNNPASAAVKSLSAKLLVDIAKRYGWTKYEVFSGDTEAFRTKPDADQLAYITDFAAKNPKSALVFPHKAWASTQCPGTLPYADIVAEANKILSPTPVDPTPTDPKPSDPGTSTPPSGDDTVVTVGWLKKLLDAIISAIQAFFGKSNA